MKDEVKTIYSGQIIDLTLEMVELPNGVKLNHEVVVHPGGAAVVVLNIDGEICLLRQYRHVFKDWIWELPAGKIDNKESPLSTATRELQEETGIRARHWEKLGSVISSPGVFSEIVHLFLADDIEIGSPKHEDGEIIEIHWLKLNRAREMVINNTINDSKTAIGIFRACEYLHSKQPSK